MARRALLTESERRALAGDHDRDRAEYEAAARLRRRLREQLGDDLETLARHRPDLFAEVRAAVDAADRVDRADTPDAVGTVDALQEASDEPAPAPTDPAPVDADASTSAPPAADAVDWDAVDVRGDGAALAARESALRDCYEYVRREQSATPADLRSDVLAAADLEYAERTEWRRIRDGLQQLAEQVEAFEAPGEGGQHYRWHGAE